jgi:hypothetical protein
MKKKIGLIVLYSHKEKEKVRCLLLSFIFQQICFIVSLVTVHYCDVVLVMNTIK